MAKDYYQILGVTEGADQQEIKKAYRQKALELHPDVNASADAAVLFQEVKEAYEVLGDAEARVHYDSGTVTINFEDFEKPVQRQYYHEAPKPPPTDFRLYRKRSTIICVIAFLFALTFFFDLFIQKNLGKVQVDYTELSDYTLKNGGSYHVYVETKVGNFNAVTTGSSMHSGEVLDMKSSYIYGFLTYKRASDTKFQLTENTPMLMFFMAGIVLFAGIFGITPFTKPERKFNAAIVGCFFSLILIVFLLAV